MNAPATVNSKADLERIEEAREWLRKGLTSRELVDPLIENIAAVRGQEIAAALRQEMRHQWATRRHWWREGCPE